MEVSSIQPLTQTQIFNKATLLTMQQSTMVALLSPLIIQAQAFTIVPLNAMWLFMMEGCSTAVTTRLQTSMAATFQIIWPVVVEEFLTMHREQAHTSMIVPSQITLLTLIVELFSLPMKCTQAYTTVFLSITQPALMVECTLASTTRL